MFGIRHWPQRGRGQGVWGNNCKWHIHPGASPNNFGSSGWGPRVSPLSSLIALWGVICKYGSVMNLFSFPNPPCCLLNHLCSTWATTVSSTDALALELQKVALILSRYGPSILSALNSWFTLGGFALNCELCIFQTKSNFPSYVAQYITDGGCRELFPVM